MQDGGFCGKVLDYHSFCHLNLPYKQRGDVLLFYIVKE